MKTNRSDNIKLSQEIFIALRDRIIHLDYPPETVLSEKELCAEFNVSRTPLREAILKLEEMNLVQSIPRYGTYVTHIDNKELRDTYEAKINLEMLAGSLAAQRITEDGLAELEQLSQEVVQSFHEGNVKEMFKCDFQFHEAIWRASRNEVIVGILISLHARCLRFCMATIPEADWDMLDAEQFGNIFEAIKSRDSKKVSTLLAAHNQKFIDYMKNSSFEVGKQ